MFCGRYGSPAHDTHTHTDVGFLLVRNIRIYTAAFGASLQLRFDLWREKKNRIPAHFYLNFTDRYGRFTQKYAKIRINTHDTEQYANST